MIQLDNSISPSEVVLAELLDWQSGIVGDLPVRLQMAKEEWERHNRQGNPTMDAVKACLGKMCSGARRCMYCEDSAAKPLDHFWPKALYPDKVFQWENLSQICGDCNSYKWKHFAIFNADGGVELLHHLLLTDLRPDGAAVLINPRFENPMDFAVLDLKGTFRFSPHPKLSDSGKRRFDYTFVKVLKLNEGDRDHLMDGRKQAYGDYKARFKEYIHEKQAGASAKKLDLLIQGIQTHNHLTVWREMQRYHREGWMIGVDAEVDRMFLDAPEALTW